MNNEEIRLVKVILESGFASRRKCEKAILSGRVRVNNEIILEPAYKVKEKDTVSLDRKIIERQNKRYMALYKPLGVVSTTKYLPGRRIITEFFKGIKERLFYAGRLDSESRGIMIITNDGEFANIITHPSYEILKVYDVVVNGKIDSDKLLEASKGITIKNINYSPFKFKILSKGRIQSKIRLTINEGKNREIRKIFEHLGYKVIDLERISVGCVSKYNEVSGTLEAGHIRDLTEKEIAFFFNQKDKKLKDIEIKWKDKHACCVVMVSGGYPSSYSKGYKITGTDNINGKCFIAGAKLDENKDIITSGGRVLNVVNIAGSLQEARKLTYNDIEKIDFKDKYFRKDIGLIK